MKINVPFHSAPNEYCAQACVKMVLEYFRIESSPSLKELAKLTHRNKDGSTWSIGIAKALAKYGLKVKFYTQPIHPEIKYVKDQKMLNILEKLLKSSRKIGVEIYEGEVKAEMLKHNLNKGLSPILLIDWNKLKGRKGYQGHFVVLTGYNLNRFYIHNLGPEDAQAFLEVKKKVLLREWKEKGTNSNLIVANVH
jgi:ABC-type bacteriocin/lantibiotic exporter with double-glycine peptidase domain